MNQTNSEVTKEAVGKYWGATEHNRRHDALFAKLVPVMGPADTLEGEILRAVTRLYYEFFNNGFGNSKYSEAEFLIKNKRTISDFAKKNNKYDLLESYIKAAYAAKNISIRLEENRNPNYNDITEFRNNIDQMMDLVVDFVENSVNNNTLTDIGEKLTIEDFEYEP